MDIKQAINKSGLFIEEFGGLCGVSRISVYAWMKGKPINELRQARVEAIVAAVEAATEAGDLPIERPKTRKVDKKMATDQIKKIVIKHLKLIAAGR